MPTLSPCPFCGGTEFDRGGSDVDVYVQCRECLAEGPVATLGCRDTEDPEDFPNGFDEETLEREAAELWNKRAPIPLVIHCPRCGTQHVDAPEPATGWTNPPHRSHQCGSCKCVFRTGDVETVGVISAATRGLVDTWPSLPGEFAAALEDFQREAPQAFSELGAIAKEKATP
jgi:Lar family restriction alleviation protein